MSKTVKKLLSISIMVLMIATAFGIFTAPEVSAASGLPNVSSLKANAGQTSVTLSWKKLSKKQLKKVNGIAIYRNGSLVKNVSKKATGYTDPGLSAGAGYSYTVKTYKATKKKEWFNKQTQEWQKKKPAKKWRGKSRKIKKYSAGVVVNVVTHADESQPVIEYKYYTVTWENWDNTVLKTEQVKEGTVPTYTGSTPIRPNDNNYSYTFKGWDPIPAALTGSKTYTAQYKATLINQGQTDYTYNIHLLNEPYGHGGETTIYLETNNPNKYSYDLGILNSSGQDKKINIIYSYYDNSSNNDFDDIDVSLLNGHFAVCSPECCGNCTFVVYEYNDNGRKIVAAKDVYVKDFAVEEQQWIGSVVNAVTTTNMSNAAKMDAICQYILSNFNYSLVNSNTGRYINLATRVSIPYWKDPNKRLDSYSSPIVLVKFGNYIGYTLHNCYNDYETGTSNWQQYHMKVYSEEDNLYFSALPSSGTGLMNPADIQVFNPNTYQYWGE